MNKPLINIVLYLRVSTDEQAEKGFSLDYQEESLRRFCEIKGYNIVKVFREDHSAKNFDRPEWNKLHAYVKANKKSIHKLLFAKWDRFSRNIEQAFTVLAQYEEMGIEVNASEQLLDPQNPDNRMILAMYLAIGETERLKISSRTKDGTYQAKKEGYFTSKAPYGYNNIRNLNKKSTLSPNKDAAFIIRAFNEIAKNVESIDSIRRKLQSEGMKISKQTFYRAIRNVTYAGKILVPSYKKEPSFLADAKHEALIDFETFKKVQAIRDGKRWNKVVPSHKNPNFPLRNFLICECGKHITGSTSSGRSKKYSYYHCCPGCSTRVRLDEVHLMVSNLIVGLQINSNVKELFKEVLIDKIFQKEGNRQKLLEAKVNERTSLKSKMEEIEDRLANKDISSETFNSIITRYQDNLREINAEIENLNQKDDSLKDYINDGLEMLLNLNTLFLESDYDGKRIIAGSLFTEKIVLGNNGCRITKVNEVLELLTRKINSSVVLEKEKAVKNDGLSHLVPEAGLEPARPQWPQDFKSCVSTNSTTRAKKNSLFR